MTSIAIEPTPISIRRYSGVAIGFHWLIAALIVTNIYIGWRMGDVAGMDKFTYFQLHKSVGITVLTLSVLRLGWRLINPPPPYPATMTRWERIAASALHHLFYVLMIGLPLSGWVLVSASPLNIPTLLYGTVPLPHLGFIHDLPMATRKVVAELGGNLHGLVAWTFGALILLHIAAALKHQFIDRDGVLGRMLPGAGAQTSP